MRGRRHVLLFMANLLIDLNGPRLRFSLKQHVSSNMGSEPEHVSTPRVSHPRTSNEALKWPVTLGQPLGEVDVSQCVECDSAPGSQT